MSVSGRTPQHADHDTFLVAQLAADDLRPSERPVALALAADCDACAGLLADLRAIASATSDLPPIPATATRTRDFRLTEADAARLRRGSWRRWLRFAQSPRLSFTQSLGVGLATIGLAGLLISGTGLPFTGSASMPAPEAAAGGPAVHAAPGDGSPGVGASDSGEFTTRVAADASATAEPATGASSPAAPMPSVAAQAPVAPGASPESNAMVESLPPDEDATKIADSAPAGGEGGEGGEGGTEGLPADSVPAGDTQPQAAANVDAPSPWANAGWLALIVAGLFLLFLRPFAGRIASRR